MRPASRRQADGGGRDASPAVAVLGLAWPRRATRLALAGLCLIYAAGHLAWYSTTPLGLHPVLDGREMLELASAIARGELGPEPFFRAPLYPGLLAVLLWLGVPEALLPEAARVLNLALHLVATLAMHDLVLRVAGHRLAAGVAAAVYALYPVSLHFAGDPLDTTAAMALAAIATRFAVVHLQSRSAGSAAAAAGFMALASIARPHYLPVLLLICGGYLVLAARRERLLRAVPSALLVFAAAAAPLLAVGVWNLEFSGQFRILPWQSGHNLWAGNGLAANGRFFTQTWTDPSGEAQGNGARLESVALFRQATGSSGPLDVAELDRFWRRKALDEIASDPARWLALMLQKLRFLLNDHEQYNNKTYWLHKAQSPWLRWNPLGWGVIFTLAAGGCVLALREAPARALVLMALAYAAGVLLYFVSDRFRLPLILWLIPLGAALFVRWRHAAAAQRAVAVAAMLVAAALAYHPLPEGMREETLAEDWLLLAEAHNNAGRHDQAEQWALRALERQPGRPTALALWCAARHGQWAAGLGADTGPVDELALSLQACAAAGAQHFASRYRLGYLLAAACRHDEALAVLHSLPEHTATAHWARSLAAAIAQDWAAVDPDSPAGRALAQAERSSAARDLLHVLERGRCSVSG